MAINGMKKWERISFSRIADERGCLSVIEGGNDIDFNIARVYYLYDLPEGAERAAHAHRDLHQVYLPMSGSFDVHLTDGSTAETITLDRPNCGVLIRPGVWRRIDNFSSGAVCFVLASEVYTEEDYIRNYDEFVRYAAEQVTSD
jgi:oxalate decarboxylase/phosphoglucose isomerase-like protein (cupin superfamily)